MSTLNDRIRDVRKDLGFSQTDFAQELGISQRSVSWGEQPGNNVPDSTIKSICRAFNVSESWLRTGTGEMYVQLSRDEELASFFGDVAFSNDSFKRRLLSVLSRLDESEWELLEHMANALVEEEKKTGH